MSHYHHLTLRDRVFISALTISGKLLSEIACAIEKNVSTISRELKRNKAASAQNAVSTTYMIPVQHRLDIRGDKSIAEEKIF